jgi:hypothetical protein
MTSRLAGRISSAAHCPIEYLEAEDTPLSKIVRGNRSERGAQAGSGCYQYGRDRQMVVN